MPKITRHGGASNRYTEGVREDAGTGEPMEAIELPADGTEGELTGDGSGRALPDAHSSGESEPSDQANAMVTDDGVPVGVRDLSGPLTDEEAEQVERIAAAHTGEEQRVSVLGEEESSPGNSSQTSPEKPLPSEKPNEAAHQKPAPTTGSRSRRGRTGSSTARSTAGSGRETEASEDS